MEHRNCKTVIDIEKAAENLFSDSHGVKIIQSMKDLIERLKDCKAVAEDFKNNVPNKRELAANQVEQTRKHINCYLDELKVAVYRNSKDEINIMEEQIHVCNASLSSLSKSSSDIDRIMSVGDKKEKFAAISMATKQTKQYCNLLVDMYRGISEMNLKIEPNVALSDIFQSLETIPVQTSKATGVFTDTIPIYMYTGEMKVKNFDDEKPFLTRFDVLQDGRKVVLDIDNDSVQLYARIILLSLRVPFLSQRMKGASVYFLM